MKWYHYQRVYNILMRPSGGREGMDVGRERWNTWRSYDYRSDTSIQLGPSPIEDCFLFLVITNNFNGRDV